LSGLITRIILLRGGSSFNFNGGNGLLSDFFVFHFGDDLSEYAIEALAEVPHTRLMTAVVIDDLAESSISHLDFFDFPRIHRLLYGASGGSANAILQLGRGETVFTLETRD